jgi:hypothetical protein
LIDVLADLYTIYTTKGQDLQTLLNDPQCQQLVIDFDPGNIPRPYVIATQSNYTNAYEPMGKTMRDEKLIVQFLAYADTRALCWNILNELEALYLSTIEGLGPPTVADKITQLDKDKIDAWKGTLNMVFFVEQSQPSFS